MPSDRLKVTVTEVLRNPWLALINFELNGLRVTGSGYVMVRLAVEAGKMTCGVGVPQPGDLAKGMIAGAAYDPPSNQFRFPSESFGEFPLHGQQIDIVHEATHAQFDLTGYKQGRYVLAIDDEAAAWLAAALFGRLSEFNPGDSKFEHSPEWHALRLADKVLSQTQGLRKGPSPYRVLPDDTANLREAIARDYNYMGGRAGIKSVYDGV